VSSTTKPSCVAWARRSEYLIVAAIMFIDGDTDDEAPE
jgi:hypothetical protein